MFRRQNDYVDIILTRYNTVYVIDNNKKTMEKFVNIKIPISSIELANEDTRNIIIEEKLFDKYILIEDFDMFYWEYGFRNSIFINKKGEVFVDGYFVSKELLDFEYITTINKNNLEDISFTDMFLYILGKDKYLFSYTKLREDEIFKTLVSDEAIELKTAITNDHDLYYIDSDFAYNLLTTDNYILKNGPDLKKEDVVKDICYVYEVDKTDKDKKVKMVGSFYRNYEDLNKKISYINYDKKYKLNNVFYFNIINNEETVVHINKNEEEEKESVLLYYLKKNKVFKFLYFILKNLFYKTPNIGNIDIIIYGDKF